MRLDTGAAAIAGGDSGPAVTPGKPEESLLWKRIVADDESERMPPEGPGLNASERDLLRAWIGGGAAVPPGEVAERLVSDHWVFRPIARPELPEVGEASWVQTPIDRFILSALETRGVQPSAPAARATLIRRMSLDLLGLLPGPEEVASFELDERPDALDRLSDRLLASPAYGERWGRHWLDQARYADSNGYTRDFGREIWPYRDWVLAAINADMPFDRFTLEQLAGDLLPDAGQDQLVATGFHRNTLINEEGGTDPEQFRVDAVADRVATTGAVWLGLTLGCARCHNHKYDPISQREFYQLFAFFNTCDEPTIESPTMLNREQRDLERRDAIRRQIAELERQFESQRAELEASQRAWESTVTPEQRARLPGPIQIAYDMPFEKRDAQNKKAIEDYYRQHEHALTAFPILREIAQLRATEPAIPQTLVLRERAEPRVTHVHKRGDFLNPGVAVPPGVPAVLPPLVPNAAGKAASEGVHPNRTDLARWICSSDHPLTARVIVNRHWQQFFGRGLVETDDDFGTQGTRPTHPALLDWLASEFRDGAGWAAGAWSTKRLHRLVLASATYQQTSTVRPELAERDPRNDWLGRQSRLRVEAEIVRDAALSASGLLTRRIGGPSVHPPQPEGVYAFTQDPKPWTAATGEDRYRRGMYTFFWRSLPYPMLTTFDAPNANVTCTRRLRSNTPLQALTLANDTAFVECAQALARRVVRESPDELSERARYAFRLCLARAPSAEEGKRLVEIVTEQRAIFTVNKEAARAVAAPQPSEESQVVELAAWTEISRVLLNLDEFITRE